ncbi:hypothetical protein BGZ58_001575 [Dissophora ornata]|nr:hypothetical protein BGZ58_001575 [Dissophora ornata]
MSEEAIDNAFVNFIAELTVLSAFLRFGEDDSACTESWLTRSLQKMVKVVELASTTEFSFSPKFLVRLDSSSDSGPTETDSIVAEVNQFLSTLTFTY